MEKGHQTLPQPAGGVAGRVVSVGRHPRFLVALVECDIPAGPQFACDWILEAMCFLCLRVTDEDGFDTFRIQFLSFS